VPARYGYEHLIMELSQKLGEKVFIHESAIYEQYLSVSCLNSCITMNQQNARIHLQRKIANSPISASENDFNLHIHLSAMNWTNWMGGSFVSKTGERSLRVCYATHNSLNEIKEFLLFLKPKKIVLNSVPSDPLDKIQMNQLVEEIQQEYIKIDEPQLQRKFLFKRLRASQSPYHSQRP
jgi:DNA repair metallo-beta-lactamase